MNCVGFSRNDVIENVSLKECLEKPNAWIDLENPSKEELDVIAEEFNIHSLSIEDCVTEEQNPKIEVFPSYAVIVFKDVYLENNEVKTKHLGMLLGDKFLITIHKKEIPAINCVKKQLLAKKQRLLKKRCDFLTHEILDFITDDYFRIFDRAEDHVELLEKEALKEPEPEFTERIIDARAVLVDLRRIFWSERVILSTLSKPGADFVRRKNLPYFRDMHDHLVQLVDWVDNERETLRGVLEIHLSTMNAGMTEVMKTLTVIATLVLVPTLITGIYGMNFTHMPEIDWQWGYLFSLGLMGVSVIAMLSWFKRKGWL
jgi:magnesium transporter